MEDVFTIFYLLIYLAIAAICGVLVGNDAQKRGMSQWWAIFVFLVFIIGLPMYVIMRKPLISGCNENTTKKCPFCAEIIQAEAIKCKHCSSELTTGTY
jgi:hypothetical protein